jgi:hypothetical protein
VAVTERNCQHYHQLAVELGLLAGCERADALAHVSRCPCCQPVVTGLATIAARLVELVPDADPPPGFDLRVLAAIDSARLGVSAESPGRADRRCPGAP